MQYVDGKIYIVKKKSRQKYPLLILETSPEDFFSTNLQTKVEIAIHSLKYIIKMKYYVSRA